MQQQHSAANPAAPGEFRVVDGPRGLIIRLVVHVLAYHNVYDHHKYSHARCQIPPRALGVLFFTNSRFPNPKSGLSKTGLGFSDPARLFLFRSPKSLGYEYREVDRLSQITQKNQAGF